MPLDRSPLSVSLSAVFDKLDEPVSVFRRDGVYVYLNPAGEALLGKRSADLIGKSYLADFPDLADHPYHEAFTRVAAGQAATVNLEFHYAPLNRWSSQRIFLADGHVIVLWRDVTAQKQAELAMREATVRATENERQFRTMIEGMPQLGWWARADGFIQYYNPRWYQFTGTTPAQMEGWGWTSVHDPALLPSVLSRWKASVETGQPFEMEFPLRRHDGVFRWFLTRVTPLRSESGEVWRWVGINTDIDDQKRAVEQLTDTLESMSDAFLLVDPSWSIVRVNRVHERISQSARAETIGKSLWQVFPGTADPTRKYFSQFHQAMDQRVAAHFEEYYAPLDSWSEIDVFPAADGGISIFYREIGERKRLDEEKARLLAGERAARAEAEAANRAKDEFVAMLGHELRNPLAPIVTALELMRQQPGAATDPHLAVIARQAKHLTGLVDDLLDVSRIVRGTVELSRERLALDGLAARAVEIAQPLLTQHRHVLTVRVGPELWVDGDAQRLVQVFSNLLTNAAKYTPTRGSIELSAGREHGEIVLRVSDNGVGIGPELLPVLFDPFVQGPQGLSRPRGGLGLGLAIVRRLVAAHGGRVTAQSDGLSKGATFTVFLPEAGQVNARQAPTPPVRPALARVQRQILVVDDNVDAADMITELLRVTGYQTRTAYDGAEALALVAQFKPDIAVLDLGLPRMNGFELARALRARSELSALRLIALTGYGQPKDREQAREAGFDAHLVKPVDVDKLLSLLETLGAGSASAPSDESAAGKTQGK